MSSSKKRGIILMNLGSPDSPSVPHVKSYLKEFLMDKRVIDSPYLLRSILVHGMITPFRAPKSAEAYESIWTEEGSPLVTITRDLCSAVQKRVDAPIEMAMRYGKPTMQTAFDNLMTKNPGIEEVILLPLYPHYAMSSYETAVEHARTIHRKQKYPFSIAFVQPFYNNKSFIKALTDSIRPYLESNNGHLLFSYHSIPEKHILKSDPTGNHCFKSPDCCDVASPCHAFCYRHQCLETTKLVVKELGLSPDRYSNSFQSKLGRDEWLKPATTARLEQMPKEGIKDLLVVCPSFVADCLETLEEIAIREKENFIGSGGKNFTFIPCMNVQEPWIDTVVSLLNDPAWHTPFSK